jgi:glycosyltransferase involved in cell wall biosynthesis
VISELKATALENYWLTLRFRKRHALWGHVYPTVGVGSRVDLRVERWMMNRAAHVFAYTDNGGKAALAAGVAPPHITVLRNSVDTSGLRSAIADVSTDDIERFQAAHGLRGGPVVASIGALDDSKRIGFLLEATEALRSRIPGLGVIIAGDGPLASEVREFARLRPNVSAIGRAGNFEKAIISHLASALLNPGRVGLIAVESLVMGTPLITTDWPYHSVEFEYLRTGENALVTADSVEEFVRDTVDVLNHPQRLEFLRTSALEDSLRYDLSATVERFATGILSALDEQTASRNDLW